MLKIDKIQEKQIRLLFITVAALGAVTSILLYNARKKGEKSRQELFELDKQIKELQLRKLRKEVGS
jgi:hypothetical protein